MNCSIDSPEVLAEESERGDEGDDEWDEEAYEVVGEELVDDGGVKDLGSWTSDSVALFDLTELLISKSLSFCPDGVGEDDDGEKVIGDEERGVEEEVEADDEGEELVEGVLASNDVSDKRVVKDVDCWTSDFVARATLTEL